MDGWAVFACPNGCIALYCISIVSANIPIPLGLGLPASDIARWLSGREGCWRGEQSRARKKRKGARLLIMMMALLMMMLIVRACYCYCYCCCRSCLSVIIPSLLLPFALLSPRLTNKEPVPSRLDLT